MPDIAPPPAPAGPPRPRRRRAIPVLVLCAGLLAAVLPVPARPAGQDVADEIFYHFMPIAWRDSDGDTYRFGDFGGMTASLDYLETLGVTAVWMNPVFPSPAYHGYQHGPADQLNPWFGDEADLVFFLEAAHARGIRVFVDLVAYGISHDSVYFEDAFGNPASQYDSWLAFTNHPNTEYHGSTFPTWDGATVGQIWWDLRDPHPVALVTQWAQHWLDPDGDGDLADGLDGYRLDHVWETYPYGEEGWGYHVDTFWAPWREALRTVNPDVFVFAEQADWGSHGAELLAGLDAAFTKPLEFAARDALRDEQAARLYAEVPATMAALAGAPAVGTFLTTIGDHDVDRLATAIGDGFEKGKAAAAVLLTLPFPPVIYHGDEIGMRGAKNTSYTGDAADIPMREPFKWNAVHGPPMSNYWVLNAAAYAGRYARDDDGRSVEEQLGVPGSLLEAYRELIAARRAQIALRRGGLALVPATSGSVWACVRDHPDQQVLVVVNLGGAAVAADLDLGDFAIPGGTTIPVDLLGSGTLPALTDANKAAYPVALGAYGCLLLEVAVTAPAPPVSVTDGLAIPAGFGPERLVATQDNATGLGDNVSELDQLFLRDRGDSLFLGATGNLATDGTGLCVLLDTGPGGQNVLDLSNMSPPPAGPDLLTGLALDAGFAPDRLLFVNAWAGAIYVDDYELLSGGGAAKTYRGQGTVGDGDGFLYGGVNPHGMQVALDNGNTAGVTDADASGAATAESGFELLLPLAALGLAAGEGATVGVAVFLLAPDGGVSNQWLPGLGGGYANLGLAPDLAEVPGDQFAAVQLVTAAGDPGALPADPLAPHLSVASANPSGGDVVFAFALVEPGPARLEIFDVRGRRLRTLHAGTAGAGERRLAWDGTGDGGERLPGGVYLARLETAAGTAVRKVVVAR